MKELVQAFIEEKNKRENKPIFLYEIYDYDGIGTNLYFCEYTETLVFEYQEYAPFPITFESMGEQTGGETDEVKVTVGNVSRFMQAYLETYEFRDKKVRILQVFADIIDNPDAYLEHIYYIDRWEQLDSQTVIFHLASKFNVRDIKVPRRLYIATGCRWKFGSEECGYSNGITTCNRTLQRCKELGNNVRYGGFPAAGGKRLFI